MGGKGGGGGPVTDPYELMQAGARYNRINQYTPTGSVVYSGPDNTTATVSLSPEQQAILTGQQQLTQNALAQMLALGGTPTEGPGTILGGPSATGYGLEAGASGQAPGADLTAFGPLTRNMDALSLYLGGQLPSNGLDLSALPAMPGAGDFSADRAKVEQAQFERAMGLLRPQQEAQTAKELQMLSNRGVPETAKLADIMANRRAASFGDQNLKAAYDAILAGGAEQSRMAGLGFQARGMGLQEMLSDLGAQQGIRGQLWNELTQQYGMGRGQETEQFNRLAALLGMSQVGTPGAGMAGFWQPGMVDVTGAANAANQGYQLQQEYSMGNQLMDLVGSLGGAALAASSVHVKKDFEEVDCNEALERLSELDVKRWRYKWEQGGSKHIGPMAEDFAEAFGTPTGEEYGHKIRSIDLLSMLGVSFAAIKALKQRVEELESGG